MTDTDTDTDNLDDEDDQEEELELDVRRIVGWVVLVGLAIGVAAAAFLIWETYSANKAALQAQAPDVADGEDRTPAPDPGAPSGADDQAHG